MKLRTVTFILLVVLQWHEAPAKQATIGDPFFETFSINDYSAGPTNRSITQNEQGVLFFANNFGVVKYDGVEWELIPVDVREGLSATSVLYHQGKIYTGSQREFGYFDKNSI
ncbi:MAG: hypothetical protein AAFO69_20485, partial [Bacteroidota bacterium]